MKNKDQRGFEYFGNWFFNHKALTSLLIILLFAIPLIIVHFLFKWESNADWIVAEWNAGDVIAYIAGFEAFIGTAFLSFLALWQNQKYKQENDMKDQRLIEIETEKIRLSNMPQFIIQTCNYERVIDPRFSLGGNQEGYVPLNHEKTHGFFIQENEIGFVPANKIPIIKQSKLPNFFSIVNCGNNTAHQVKLIFEIEGHEYHDEKVYSVRKDDEMFLYLGVHSAVKISGELLLKIRFFDSFQNVYEQGFIIVDAGNGLIVRSYADVKLIKRSDSITLKLT